MWIRREIQIAPKIGKVKGFPVLDDLCVIGSLLLTRDFYSDSLTRLEARLLRKRLSEVERLGKV